MYILVETLVLEKGKSLSFNDLLTYDYYCKPGFVSFRMNKRKRFKSTIVGRIVVWNS